MPINILMPALSPTMEKGNLAKWLKKEGETVKTGDVIAEIETDKATMEYEAVDDGVMAKIVVPEGTHDVPVNQLIAVMAQEGEDPKAAAAAVAKAALPRLRTVRQPSSPSGSGSDAERAATTRSLDLSPRGRGQPREAGRVRGRRPRRHGTNRVFSSPLARRLAKDAGIDIGRIAGSGPHGRVIARDVSGGEGR